MSERQINDSQPTPQAPASVDMAARQLASARRRRFIKLGGAAVPTALSLASRPVMAWHCNTASTWGSVQGLTNSAYTRSRVDNVQLFPDETYPLSCWVGNTPSGSNLTGKPWLQSPISRTDVDTTVATHYKNATISQLLTPFGASINGLVGTDTIWSVLNGSPQKLNGAPGSYTAGSSTCGEFQKLMLVAWLNYAVLSSTLNRCLKPGSTIVLLKFGTESYVGPRGDTWDKNKVVTYLKGNWVACNNATGGTCN